MLLPFEWAILTVAEASLLMKYIETTTSTKSMPINYDKMYKAGMADIYGKLREFVEANGQYNNLRDLDTSDILTRGDL